ncbi:MAG: hypothetical protein IK095_03470 [Oscillospiraceae bacterium]|nr:hypothetical protein [Oscillospiraceae bacterium]
MVDLFLKLLNMSVAGSVLILAVILLRVLFRRAPRWIFCALWGLVALRLICPVGIPSPFSAFQAAPAFVSDSGTVEVFRPAGGSEKPMLALDTVQIETPRRDSDTIAEIPGTDLAITQRSRDAYLPPVVQIWLLGVGAMLLYALISTLLLRRKVAASLPLEGQARICDAVPTPFILGIFRPRIYLPSGLGEEERSFILAHEEAHLRRLDHIWKPLGFLILSVHWFDPLCWLAYVLLCRDIELACDEKVIRELGRDERAAYSQTLLDCSAHRILAACPVAFGETGVKTRVKAVLDYKKPAFWIVLTAALAVLALVLCFATDAMPKEPDLSLLNYENAISLIAQDDTVPSAVLTREGRTGMQPGVADREALIAYLQAARWTQRRAPKEEPGEHGSIAFTIGPDYQIVVYAYPRVAAVRVLDETRWYRIRSGDYEAALAAFIPAPSTEPDRLPEPLAVEFETKYGTGQVMAPLSDHILFSGAYSTAQVNGSTYDFQKGVEESVRLDFIRAEEELLGRLGESEGVILRVLSGYPCFSDSAKRTIYLDAGACRSWQQILATLSAVEGDYANYGYLYAKADRLARELGWTRDDTARADPSVFAEDPSLLQLVYPCFDAVYTAPEKIAACKALALEMDGETEDDLLANVAAWAAGQGLAFTPTEIRFAPYGEACPLKIRCHYVEFLRLAGYTGDYSVREGYQKEDGLADVDTMLRTLGRLDERLNEICLHLGVTEIRRLPVQLTDGLYAISGKDYRCRIYGSVDNGTYYIKSCSLGEVEACFAQYAFNALGGWEDPAQEDWLAEALYYYLSQEPLYENVRMRAEADPDWMAEIEETIGGPFDDPEDHLLYIRRLAVEETETTGYDLRRLVKNWSLMSMAFGDWFAETYGEDVFIASALAPSTIRERTGKTLDQLLDDFCEDVLTG